MTFYIRYVLTDSAAVAIPELAAALQNINPGYEIDEDYILLNNNELGQIEINAPGDGLFEDDITLLNEFAEQKHSREMLKTTLHRATSLLTVQVLHMDADGTTQVEIEPMFHWLLANRPGLLVLEGGVFYNKAGIVT